MSKTTKESKEVKESTPVKTQRAKSRIKTELNFENMALMFTVGTVEIPVMFESFEKNIQEHAGLMGLKNTLIDAPAGLTDEVEIIQAIQARVDQLYTGTWSKRKPKVDWKAKYEALLLEKAATTTTTEDNDNGKV